MAESQATTIAIGMWLGGPKYPSRGIWLPSLSRSVLCVWFLPQYHQCAVLHPDVNSTSLVLTSKLTSFLVLLLLFLVVFSFGNWGYYLDCGATASIDVYLYSAELRGSHVSYIPGELSQALFYSVAEF